MKMQHILIIFSSICCLDLCFFLVFMFSTKQTESLVFCFSPGYQQLFINVLAKSVVMFFSSTGQTVPTTNRL